jgi:hypothetical protein
VGAECCVATDSTRTTGGTGCAFRPDSSTGTNRDRDSSCEVCGVEHATGPTASTATAATFSDNSRR